MNFLFRDLSVNLAIGISFLEDLLRKGVYSFLCESIILAIMGF